jgi:hypothetical protein
MLGIESVMRKNFIYPWLPLTIFWFVSVASRYFFNGLVYDLDFGIYQPDGIWYTLRTLEWIGIPGSEAASEIASWYTQNSAKGFQYKSSDLYPVPNEVWGLVAPRILYSILSIPFVLILGIKGMLVIPSISLLILMTITVLIAKHFDKLHFGFALAVFFSTSPTILRWAISNTTDSLLLGLFAIVAFLMIKIETKPNLIYLMLIMVVLTNITRVSTPIWLALSLILFLNSSKVIALWIMVVNFITTIPVLLLRPQSAFLPLQQDDDFLTKFFSLPKSLIKVGFFEIAEIAVLDRLFLLFLFLSLLGSIFALKHKESQYFLAVLLAVWLLGAINGNIGVNFRYQLPLIPFAIIPFLNGLTNFGNWNVRGALNVIRKKTQ